MRPPGRVRRSALPPGSVAFGSPRFPAPAPRAAKRIAPAAKPLTGLATFLREEPLASPWGWLALLSPAIILYLLLRVTGIPLTEQQSLRSKGDAYRQYQTTTSAFIPWLPKR